MATMIPNHSRGYRCDDLHLRVLGKEPSVGQCSTDRLEEVKSALGIDEVGYL
jgi:hypothetical protein